MINSHLLFKFKFNKTQKRITKTFGTQILKTIFIYMKHKEFNYNHLIKKKEVFDDLSLLPLRLPSASLSAIQNSFDLDVEILFYLNISNV